MSQPSSRGQGQEWGAEPSSPAVAAVMTSARSRTKYGIILLATRPVLFCHVLCHVTSHLLISSPLSPYRREKQHSDPTQRFEAYQRKTSAAKGAHVQSCHGNTTTSGSFGGRPKAVRKTGGGKRRVPPAWLTGGKGEEEG